MLLFVLGTSQINAQECFFLKNVLDTLYQINPITGLLVETPMATDFPGQSFFGYLSSIDPAGRRYMFVTRLTDTSFDSFGLKVIDLDSMQTTSVPLSGYEAVSPGIGQFSFHGLEYGVIADKLYMAPVSGDSLYSIDMTSGAVCAEKEIPGFARTYSYLQTFYQSEQRYAMIGLDDNGQRRFYQIDIDDDTILVSPPLNFAEPLRGLEVSDFTGKYYAVSDDDQQFYEIDPITGSMTALFQLGSYQNALGYLHTFDYNADQYLIVGMDSTNSLQLYSVFLSTGTVISSPFPVPLGAFFGLEATNTQYIAKMLEDLNNNNNTTSIDEIEPLFQVFPNPTKNRLSIELEIAAPIQLGIYDLEGKLLSQNAYPPQIKHEVKLGDYPAGTYLIQVQDLRNGRTWQERFVILP